MKEFTIEEKAKAYDKALDAIKNLREVNPSDEGLQNWVNENFPELKENEDERIRKGLIQYFNDFNLDTFAGLDPKKILAWLDKQGEQKPAAWSEEDESHIRYLIECLEHCKMGVALTMTTSTSQEYINWLKSLKDRYTWKPSEIQLQCLYDAIEHYQTNGYPASKLNELYEQISNIYKL